ncbi:phage tail domain-containing protein [Bacillus sp. AFS017336]|uniref:phage tail domain-containing protein n=1 Tax=Bacillus sp. AFS017336 TaxID=2033489 RepID=UPI000BEF781C|nr:phage tail domain-containing protein [Bacillus sp. AFS017336]PEL13792.1 hypothetical protein CN601_03510 [Bacillus sp. AFS017336]
MIYLDDIPISQWGLQIQNEHVHPATPELRNKTMAIPGMDGEWDFGSEFGSRSFSFPIGFIEYDMYEKQRRLNEFVAFLFDPYRRPREIKLSFDYETDKYYLVKVSSQVEPSRIIGFSFFTLEFVARKPLKRFILQSDEIILDSDIPIISDILWMTDGSERLINSEQSIEVINNGNVAIRYTFIMSGSGNNVNLSSNGIVMNFGTFSNTTFNVDGESYVIYKNGVEDLITPFFIDLLPGVNQIQINGSNLNLTIKEKLLYQYL